MTPWDKNMLGRLAACCEEALAEAFGGKGAGNQGGLPGSELQLRSNPKGKRELWIKMKKECSL